jgi:hypothetical protein
MRSNTSLPMVFHFYVPPNPKPPYCFSRFPYLATMKNTHRFDLMAAMMWICLMLIFHVFEQSLSYRR